MRNEWDQTEDPGETPEPVFVTEDPQEEPSATLGIQNDELMRKVYHLQQENRQLREEIKLLKALKGVTAKTNGQRAYEMRRDQKASWGYISDTIPNALLMARNYAKKNNQPWPIEL